jgi:hypothetical protein
MRRTHLFEFEDQKWLPEIIRNSITDILHFGTKKGNIYEPILPIIEKGLEKSKKKVIIDLCSGSSGGILTINDQLKQRFKKPYSIILTDLYPNNVTLRDVTSKANNIDYIGSPVDARKVPEDLEGFRTIFVSFHHFRPKEAKEILEDAAKSNTPIGIFEITERKFLDFLISLTLHALTTIIFTPFIRPFRIGRIILTYLIPLIPICYTWDAVVSVLRSYKPEELKQMTEEISVPNYTWEIGKKEMNPVMHVVYVLGYPREQK